MKRSFWPVGAIVGTLVLVFTVATGCGGRIAQEDADGGGCHAPDAGTRHPEVDAPGCVTVRAAEYDQCCTADTDCVVVREGTRCFNDIECDGCTDAFNAAINRADYRRFTEDRFRETPEDAATVVCNCFALTWTASCETGRCKYDGVQSP